MNTKQITKKEEWEKFIQSFDPHSFLASWNWGEVQKRLGTNIFRFGLYDDEILISIALVLHIRARRGAFLFCPHGPLMKMGADEYQVLNELKGELVKLGNKLGCHFIRFSPLLGNTPEQRRIFESLGFRNAPVHLMHPELSWMLDIRKDDETLLREMRKTTRYLIRRADKDGVKIRIGDGDADLKDFLSVYRLTVDRQNFIPFQDIFFQRELEVFREDGQAKIFLAEYQGKIISAAFIIFYGHAAFYHHGASDHRFSHIPASYLLQFKVIQEAKHRGCSLYNFWGIVPLENKSHPWAGLSLFKIGFGGFSEEYLHAQDLSLTWRYWLIYIIEILRRKWRRL